MQLESQPPPKAGFPHFKLGLSRGRYENNTIKKMKPLENHQGWYVVFSKTNKYHWLLSRLKGHQHCFVMAKSPGGSYWIVVNPSWFNVTITMLFAEDFPTPQSYWGDDIEVIKYNAILDEHKNDVFFGFISCVSVVKRVLGIRKRSIITPNQLCEHIKNELRFKSIR